METSLGSIVINIVSSQELLLSYLCAVDVHCVSIHVFTCVFLMLCCDCLNDLCRYFTIGNDSFVQ